MPADCMLCGSRCNPVHAHRTSRWRVRCLSKLRHRSAVIHTSHRLNRRDEGVTIMNTVISLLIRNYHGYLYCTAGVIYAFFNDAHEAHDCAEQLSSLVTGLEVVGSQLSFWA